MSRAGVVVGVGAYPSAPLTGCVNDAKKVAALLETHANEDPNFQINLLVSKGHPGDVRPLRFDPRGGGPRPGIIVFG